MANTTNLDLVKPAGTDHALISVINQNSDKIDNFAGKTNTSLAGVQDGIAIVSNGDTHAAIASGQFVYVKNHGSLAEGLYRATAAIATDAALSTSNLAADSSGSMNALKSDIDTLNSNLTDKTEWVYIGQSVVVGGSESTPTSDAVSYPEDAKELFFKIALDSSEMYSFTMYAVLSAMSYSQSLYLTFYNDSTYNSAILQISKSARKVWTRLLNVNGTHKTSGILKVYYRK